MGALESVTLMHTSYPKHRRVVQYPTLLRKADSSYPRFIPAPLGLGRPSTPPPPWAARHRTGAHVARSDGPSGGPGAAAAAGASSGEPRASMSAVRSKGSWNWFSTCGGPGDHSPPVVERRVGEGIRGHRLGGGPDRGGGHGCVGPARLWRGNHGAMGVPLVAEAPGMGEGPYGANDRVLASKGRKSNPTVEAPGIQRLVLGGIGLRARVWWSRRDSGPGR